MKLDIKINKFIINKNSSIKEALDKINDNSSRIVFIIDENDKLFGSFSDGDFRRWLLTQENIDLSKPITEICNKKPIYFETETADMQIQKSFNSRIQYIPILRKNGTIDSIASEQDSQFKIDGKPIGRNCPTFIIAEVGNNHNGDILIAKDLVDIAKEAGSDCVKFQMRTMTELYSNSEKTTNIGSDLGDEYVKDLLKKFQLTDDEMFEVFDYCKKIDIIPLCTPWDTSSLMKLHRYGLPGFKIASADFTNTHLLNDVIKTQKPFIASTGMSTENEINFIVNFLNSKTENYALLHCNSTYPTPLQDINLKYISNLKEISGKATGYSGHEIGIYTSIAAVSIGADIVEKHITIDKSMEGNDHKVSLLPDELNEMIKGIRVAEESLGSNNERKISQGEMINRESLAKSIVAINTIEKDSIITRDKLAIVSPGKGLQPMYLETIIGKVAKKNISKNSFIYSSDFEDTEILNKNFHFPMPWGIPVRYHDINKLTSESNLDLVEFHLSYKDLELLPSEHLNNEYELDYIVHAPELFSGDHILNLCSEDKAYRKKSISNLQKVIDITVDLNSFFPNTSEPRIIVNVGGYSKDGHLKKNQRKKLYENFILSLDKLNLKGTQILPQTMPPFPWHFGGRSFHNIFVDPNEIKHYCEEHGLKVCLDISHSLMACNFNNWDFNSFLLDISRHVSHLHIADALGFDGEGVELGYGDLDFDVFSKIISDKYENTTFIPEIWQGHKNNGEGFWLALKKLEPYFKN